MRRRAFEHHVGVHLALEHLPDVDRAGLHRDHVGGDRAVEPGGHTGRVVARLVGVGEDDVRRRQVGNQGHRGGRSRPTRSAAFVVLFTVLDRHDFAHIVVFAQFGGVLARSGTGNSAHRHP